MISHFYIYIFICGLFTVYHSELVKIEWNRKKRNSFEQRNDYYLDWTVRIKQSDQMECTNVESLLTAGKCFTDR